MSVNRHQDMKSSRAVPLLIGNQIEKVISQKLDRPVSGDREATDYLSVMAGIEELKRLALLGEESRFLAHEIGQWLNASSFSIEALLLQIERNVGKGGKKNIGQTSKAHSSGQVCDPAETGFGPEYGAVIRRLSDAHASLQRARGLLHRMARFGSIDPSDANKPFRLVKSVYTMVRLLAPGLRDRGILLSLRTNCPADREIFGNVIEIEQVLANLIGNAREAFEAHSVAREKSGTEKRRIRIALFDEPSSGCVRLQVADTAGGISIDPLDKIFDPLVSSRKSKNSLGLGLAYCRRVIDEHGGILSVRNVGKGAAFDIRLPAVSAKSNMPGKERS